MTDVFLDTQFLIAAVSRQDAHHHRALEWSQWLARVKPRRHIHDGILLEIVDGFAQRGRGDIGDGLVERILADPQTVRHPMETSLANRALAFRKSHSDKRWGLTDCASFVTMREHGLTAALTADRDFAQAGFRALLLETPPST